MSAIANFQKFAGKQIRVLHPDEMGPLFFRVVAPGELDDDAIEEFLGDVHPTGEMEEGWTLTAVEGDIEEGEVQAGGFLAIHEEEDRAYVCDSGSIRYLEGSASTLTIEEEDDEE